MIFDSENNLVIGLISCWKLDDVAFLLLVCAGVVVVVVKPYKRKFNATSFKPTD